MALLLPHLPLFAANLTWESDGTAGGTTGGSGLWDTSTLLWNNAGTMTPWANAGGHVAIFGGTAGTVTLGTAVTAAGLTFNSTGYTLAGNGNTLSLSGNILVPTAGNAATLQTNITATAGLSFAIVGDVTLAAGYDINAGAFSFGKSGAGKLTMAANVTNAGTFSISAGVMDLSGSYASTAYGVSGYSFTVTGGTLNVTGTLGSSTVPTGQTAFSGNSVTNFSGTAYMSGGSSTFRIGEATNATVNVTGGTLTLGASSGGLVLGRSSSSARGFLNISGGSVIVAANGNVVRLGASYSDAETAGGGAGASVMTISGTGLFDTVTSTGTILLGSNLAGNTTGTGTINLDGGTLATGRTITGGTVGASVFNFNGGTLKANAATMTMSTTLGTVNVRDGGAIIDTNGFNVTIPEALLHSNIGGDAATDGGLTKKGLGTLTLSGTEASSYTGLTRIYAGELALSKTAGISAIVGDITLGDGTAAAMLRLVNADQIADTSVITLNGTSTNAGIFRLNGKAETLGGLSSTGGAGFVENENATSAILTLNNTGTQTFSGILRNGTLAGTLSLVKNGSGTQILSGANTYTGSTTLNAGTLQFGINNALGTTALTLMGAGGATTLALDGFSWAASTLTFYGASSTASSQGAITLGTGGLLTLGGTVTVNNTNNPLGASITGGTLDLGAATRTFSIADSSSAAADLTISSVISSSAGAFGITKTGAGTLLLTSANTFTGATNLNGGTLQFGINNALNATTTVTLIASGGLTTLALDGYSWTTGTGGLNFYGSASTASSQAVVDLGTTGLLTLGGTLTLNNNNNPLGALITGGTLDVGGATRTFSIADSSNAAADLTISSNITSTAGAFGLTKTGAGALKLTGNVTLGGAITVSTGLMEASGTVTNSAAGATTAIGSTTTPGVLRLVSGASYSTTTMSIGNSASFKAALVMQGGTLTMTTTNTMAGILLGGAGYGALMLSNGTINTNRVDSNDGTTAASISVMQVSGGTLNTARYIMFRNEHWEFTVTGGQVLRTGENIALGFRSGGTAATATATAQGAMTVAGGLVSNSALNITFGQQNDGSALGTYHLNLNAGTLINNQMVLYNGTGADVDVSINFNGGTLRPSGNSVLTTTSGSGGGSTLTTYVNGAFGTFTGGAVFDTTTGISSSISTALLAPTGNGVASIPVTAGGSGYVGAPYVEITGGGGTGATASATVDLDPASPTYGQILSITITNPGRDYTSAPTIALLGGGGTGATTGTVTTAANTSGGLTKLGVGTFTLSGTTANTYTGVTSIQAGELDLSKTAGLNAIAGDVSLGDGTAPAVLKLVNSDQMADTSVITFQGAGANAGILRLNNRVDTIGGLASTGGAGFVENESGAAGTSTLTVNVASGTQTFSGVLRNGDGSGTDGTLALAKSGAGTQVLSGVNTYTGATTISAGTLQISAGGTSGSGATTVQAGGTLQGAGSIRGTAFTAANGSTIIAGDGSAQGSYGTLTFTPASGSGSINFQPGSEIILGINPGGTSDLLNIAGTGSNTLLFNGNLTVTAAAGFVPAAPEVFNLLDWSGLTSAPTFASRFTSAGLLLGNGDEATGLDLPDISGTGYYWDISSFTTNGTIAIIVPEPSRMLLLGLALGALGIRRRRVSL